MIHYEGLLVFFFRLGSFGLGVWSRDTLGMPERKKRARGARGGLHFTGRKSVSPGPVWARVHAIHVAVRPNAQGGQPTSWAICGRRDFDSLWVSWGVTAKSSEIGKSKPRAP